MDLDYIPHKSLKIVARKSGSDYILVPIRDNIADMEAVYTLNDSGAFIWDLIDGKRSVKAIADEMVRKFNIDNKTAIKDVMDLIDDLNDYLILGK